MDVIVIGYGKIGRIKAMIWRSLGRVVWVYDTNATKQDQARADSFKLFDPSRRYGDLIVDISTPATLHADALRWVVEQLQPLPRGILIEKPLVSNETEALSMESLFQQNPTLKNRVLVNESYYLSAALEFLAKDITKNGPILSIEAEMSKNRLPDIAGGRFTDDQLGPLGIELPHMIAMTETLGLNVKDLKPQGVTVYQNNSKDHDYGFTAHLSYDGIPVTLRSYLGHFRMVGANLTPNSSTIRYLSVQTSTRHYRVLFDPVVGLGRYKASVTITDPCTSTAHSVVLDDDHLTAHLKKIHNNQPGNTLDVLCSVDNAIEVSDLIIRLKAMAIHRGVKSNIGTGDSTAAPPQARARDGVLS